MIAHKFFGRMYSRLSDQRSKATLRDTIVIPRSAFVL